MTPVFSTCLTFASTMTIHSCDVPRLASSIWPFHLMRSPSISTLPNSFTKTATRRPSAICIYWSSKVAFDTCNTPAPSRLVGSAGCDSIRWSCQCQGNLWWCTPRKIWQGQHHLPFQSLRSWRKDTFYAIDTHTHTQTHAHHLPTG